MSRDSRWLPGFALAMIAGGLMRAIMLILTGVHAEPDTPRYTVLAELMRHGDLAAGQGVTCPGYPLFILLHSSSHDAVRATQHVLGLTGVAGVYYVLWKLTGSQRLTTVGALLFGLNLGEIFYESTLLSEALATFLLVVSLALLVSLRFRDAAARSRVLVLLGAAAGMLPLVRPLYAFIPLFFALPVIAVVKTRRRQLWLYLVPAVLPMVLWMGYLGSAFGYFGLQTASGFGWTNHAGEFMSDAPDQYAAIRDIYLRRVAEKRGVWGDTIWGSIDEMQQATGQSYPQLSQTVQRLSFSLLLSHPRGYARQVASGFIDFWKGSWLSPYWQPFGTLTPGAWMLSRLIGILVSAWFCVMVGCQVLVRLRLLRLPPLHWPCGWITLAVMLAAVGQAVVEYGGAPRFGVPTYPYVVVVALCGLDAWVVRRKPPLAERPRPS